MTTKQMPRDAQVVQAILKDIGITEYEPRVVNQLLEFVYRYVSTVLDDAKAYANHAKKKAIDLDDVKLAVSMQMEQSFTTPPPREILMEVARSKNSMPLPSIKPHCGIRLPPDCYCLTACNYKLKTLKKTTAKSLGGGSAGSPRVTIGNAKTTIRPSSPVVRVTNLNTSTTTTPRAVIKVNAGNSTPTATPKIQISIPAQPPVQPQPSIQQPPPIVMQVEKQEPVESRGIKREREDDDYDVE